MMDCSFGIDKLISYRNAVLGRNRAWRERILDPSALVTLKRFKKQIEGGLAKGYDELNRTKVGVDRLKLICDRLTQTSAESNCPVGERA
jgi:hypothetical protein